MNIGPSHVTFWLGSVIGAALMPELLSPGALEIATQAACLAIFAISWDILSGRTGYLNLCHPLLIGIGAAVTGLLSHGYDLRLAYAIPLAMVATMLGALILLAPVLRLGTRLFALATLAFMGLIPQLALPAIDVLTDGNDLWSAEGLAGAYRLAAATMVIVALQSWVLMRTRFGTALRAIGQDEPRARASGLATHRIKTATLLMSAMVAGLGGAIAMQTGDAVMPDGLLDPTLLFSIIAAVLIGGRGTIVGAMVGAFVVTLLVEALGPLLPGIGPHFVIGLLALGLYMVEPGGLMAMTHKGTAMIRSRAA